MSRTDRVHRNCRLFDERPGPPEIKRAYMRVGGAHGKFVSVGDMCVRCHEVWPLQGPRRRGSPGTSSVEEVLAA